MANSRVDLYSVTGDIKDINTLLVPRTLWQQIKSVLEARRFIADEADEDNDYEVIKVLDDMRKLEIGI